MPRSNNNIERQLAEILQKRGESAADYVLRMAKLNRPKDRRGNVRGMSRKNLVRRFSKLRKGSDPPIDPQHPAVVEFMGRKKAESDRAKARLKASIDATLERLARNPEYRRRFPVTPAPGETVVDFFRRQDAYMVKPWKGSAGREVIKEVGTTKERKHRRRLQTIEWHRMGMTHAEIARKLRCSVKTVQRDLKGQR